MQLAGRKELLNTSTSMIPEKSQFGYEITKTGVNIQSLNLQQTEDKYTLWDNLYLDDSQPSKNLELDAKDDFAFNLDNELPAWNHLASASSLELLMPNVTYFTTTTWIPLNNIKDLERSSIHSDDSEDTLSRVPNLAPHDDVKIPSCKSQNIMLDFVFAL